MTPEGPPGGQAADEGSAAAGARFPAQPSPTAQSVLWRPTVQELARADSDATLIFVAQRALAAVEDHLLSAPDQALLGYLVGRVLESPESGLPYLVVHGAVRVPQMIVSGASEQVVAQSLAAVQRMLPPEDGVVVGWYRSNPTGALKISASDHAAHTRHFPRSWPIALLLTSGPAGTRGGFFRPPADGGPPRPYPSISGRPGPPSRPRPGHETSGARRAVDAYQLRATLFANHQMTCPDLATGLAAVDAAWLAYTLTSPAAAPGDTGVAPPAQGLAANVQQVEDDFERSGCPRP